MCGTAAHLVLHVLPETLMRQWVLTAPFEVRRVMALRAEALSACKRILVEEIARWRRTRRIPPPQATLDGAGARDTLPNGLSSSYPRQNKPFHDRSSGVRGRIAKE
jgi:hypothetical protein